MDEIKESMEMKDKIQEFLQGSQELVNGFSSIVQGLSELTDRKVENDIKKLKERDDYINGSQEKREDLEEGIRKKYAKARKREFYANQAAALAQIAIDTASAIMKTVGKTGFWGTPMAITMGTMGAIQAGIVLAQKPPEYGMGGLIGGKPHEQGGTPLIAEKGEYILRRDAVAEIGLDNIERMNRTGNINGGGTTININNPIISKDYVEEELPELIKEAVLKGSDFGMS
jgi:hypothetical protein